jgi:hypothetical protein
MSGAEDDDEYLEPAPFILMEAGETFDGQERWFTRATYELQTRAVPHSVVCGHPGYIPDDYLEYLNGLGIETTITAAELCAIGTWERVSDGYRCLDWEAVEYTLDGLRQSKGEDPKALAEERDHEARAWAHMATPMVVTPPCAACGDPAARIELVPPGQLPAGWDQWPGPGPGRFVRRPNPREWYILRHGLAGGNSYGGPMPATLAGQIAWALRPPLRYAQVHTARFDDDLGFCPDCEVPYWHPTGTGHGHWPYGHGKLPPRTGRG